MHMRNVSTLRITSCIWKSCILELGKVYEVPVLEMTRSDLEAAGCLPAFKSITRRRQTQVPDVILEMLMILV